MKTEEHPATAAVFPQTIIAAVSELKDRLQQDYERTYPRLGEIIRIVLPRHRSMRRMPSLQCAETRDGEDIFLENEIMKGTQ